LGFFKNTNNSKEPDKDDPKRNQMRLNFRLIGCAALGYIAFGLYTTPSPEDEMSPIIRIGVATIFMGFAVGIGILTIKEYSALRKAEKAQQEQTEIAESSEIPPIDDEECEEDYEEEEYEVDDDTETEEEKD